MHPELAREWNRVRNLGLHPWEVKPKSMALVWWRCRRGHEWQETVHDRTRRVSGCPYCAGVRAAAGTSLAALHPQLLSEWDHAHNGALSPTELRPGSGKRVAWRCKRGHRWQTQVWVRAKGAGCPYCSGRLVAPERSLATRFPELAAQWDPTRNRPLRPVQVLPRSSRKAWWRCAQGHVWEACIGDRTRGGNGCPYCSGRRSTTKTQARVPRQESARLRPQTTQHELRSKRVKSARNDEPPDPNPETDPVRALARALAEIVRGSS